MKYLLYLIYFFVATIEYYVILMCVNTVFKRFTFKLFDKKLPYFLIAAVNGIIVCNTILIKFEGILPVPCIYINQFLMFVMTVVYIYKYHSKTWYIPIIIHFVYFAMNIVFEYPLMMILIRYVDANQFFNFEYQLLGVVYFTCCFFVLALIINVLKERVISSVGMSKRMIRFLIVISIVILVSYNIALFSNKIKVEFETSVILISIIVVTLMYNWFRNQKDKKDIENLKDEVKNLSLYAQSINDLYMDVRHYKHDIGNMLLGFRGAIDKEDIIEIRKVYEEVASIEPFNNQTYKFLGMIQNITNLPLKGILLSKYEQICKLDIIFKIQILNNIDNIDIHDTDLSRIIGILFDNAIEAAQLSEKKMIVFVAECDKDSVILSVSNSFLEIPDMERMFKLNYSTKGDGRGIGLHSLMTIVNRCDNLKLFTFVENNLLTLKVIIKSMNDEKICMK